MCGEISMDKFDPLTITHYMKCERYLLGNYLKNHMSELTYESLRNQFIEINKMNGLEINDLFAGKVGGIHNQRIGFQTMPTIQFVDHVIETAVLCGVNRIEEIASGIGLISMIIRSYNDIRVREGREGIPIIGSTDGYYQLEMIESKPFTNVVKKDIADLIMDNQMDTNILFICANPYNYEICDMNMAEELNKLLIYRKPKLLLIIGENLGNGGFPTEEYVRIDFTPCVIQGNDMIVDLTNKTTQCNGNLYIRNDISEQTITRVANLLKNNNLIKRSNSDFHALFKKMAIKKMVPMFFQNMNIQKQLLIDLAKKMLDLKIKSIPIYLNDIDEVMSYIEMYGIALMNYGIIPDGISTREKYDQLRQYLDMIWVDINGLKKMLVVPTKINNSTDCLVYLIGIYYYKSTVETKLFKYHLTE